MPSMEDVPQQGVWFRFHTVQGTRFITEPVKNRNTEA